MKKSTNEFQQINVNKNAHMQQLKESKSERLQKLRIGENDIQQYIPIEKDGWQQRMPELTKKIMREHYGRNLDFVLSYTADDIMWIGPLKHQFTKGKAAFAELL